MTDLKQKLESNLATLRRLTVEIPNITPDLAFMRDQQAALLESCLIMFEALEKLENMKPYLCMECGGIGIERANDLARQTIATVSERMR